MLEAFVDGTPGVEGVLLVSSDSMLVAACVRLDRASTESVAASVAALVSLGRGAAAALEGEHLETVVVELRGATVLVTPVSDASSIAVLARSDCDLGVVTFELTRLVERARSVLSPAMVAQLRQQVLST
jgi:predicted regulator of Ras-like GTPase activity (Roadblock/LC7/MglB family)